MSSFLSLCLCLSYEMDFRRLHTTRLSRPGKANFAATSVDVSRHTSRYLPFQVCLPRAVCPARTSLQRLPRSYWFADRTESIVRM